MDPVTLDKVFEGDDDDNDDDDALPSHSDVMEAAILLEKHLRLETDPFAR